MSEELSNEMFVRLKDVPSDIPDLIFDILYHFDKSNNTNFCFFICRDLMIKYNLDKQEITQRYKQKMEYPDTCCIDPHNQMLYIIDNWKQWIVFNIQTNEWIKDFHRHKESGYIQTLFFIPEPLNQLHAIWCNRRNHDIDRDVYHHYRVNKAQSGLELLKRDLLPRVPGYRSNHFSDLKITFNPSANQLLLMTCSERRMFVCDVTRKNQKTFNWELCDFKFEQEIGNDVHMNGMGLSFIAWNQIYCLFNMDTHELYCIDLLLNPQKIYCILDIAPYKSRYRYFAKAIRDIENYIHFFGYQSAFHVKVALHHLMPKDIVEINKSRMNKLIFGYCRQHEKARNVQYIPIYLKELLAQFCPVFL